MMKKALAFAFLLVLAAVQALAQQPASIDRTRSSSGAWIGKHNNTPRVTLSPVGGVFTPPWTYGNWWLTTGAANQTIACPPDIADGDSMNIHIQQGASAPFSPNISFNSPCYAWTTGVQPTWSTAVNAVDWVFCQSMVPPDVTGASLICAPQLAVAAPQITSVWATPGGANCQSTFTLTNNNLTASMSSGGAWFTCRATTSHTTGQYYFFATMSAVNGSGWIIGFENASGSLSNFPGNDLNGVGAQPAAAVIWFNSNPTNTGTHNQGTIVRVDVDLTNKWVGFNPSDTGVEMPAGCNPITGASCLSFSTWNGGAAFPAFGANSTGGANTAILNTTSGAGPGAPFVLWQ